jgi:hypothetical protein
MQGCEQCSDCQDLGELAEDDPYSVEEIVGCVPLAQSQKNGCGEYGECKPTGDGVEWVGVRCQNAHASRQHQGDEWCGG